MKFTKIVSEKLVKVEPLNLKAGLFYEVSRVNHKHKICGHSCGYREIGGMTFLVIEDGNKTIKHIRVSEVSSIMQRVRNET